MIQERETAVCLRPAVPTIEATSPVLLFLSGEKTLAFGPTQSFPAEPDLPVYNWLCCWSKEVSGRLSVHAAGLSSFDADGSPGKRQLGCCSLP